MSDRDRLVTVLEVVLGLQAGERVRVVTDGPKGHLGSLFADAAARLGGEVSVYELSEEDRPLSDLPAGLQRRPDSPDVWINIFDARPEETPFRVALLEAQMDGRARVGHAPGLTDEMLGTGALTADYRAMQAAAERLLARLRDARTARVTNPAGSDITLNIEGREFLTDVVIGPGGVGNLPAGEVFCAPVEDGAEGVIVADAAVGGLPLGEHPVTLRLQAGRLSELTCDDDGLLARLRPLLDVDDEARVVGELGIGLNPRARITNNMLEGEKAGGTVHIALGNNADMPGGQNQSVTHRDFLMKQATVEVTYIDGDRRTLVADGRLADDDLSYPGTVSPSSG